MAKINNGIINNYTIRPKNLLQYTAFRGVTDYTQIGQFHQFESGYSFLYVIKMPEFMRILAEQDPNGVGALYNSFKHMLEYEFKGLDGLPDMTSETYQITDGVNEQNLINKVTWDTSVTISSEYYERSGGLISKFTELYLTGIKDKMTQAKTYHGLIKQNLLEPNPENEVFTMLYVVTDNTMLRIEKAVLLCNCQLTTARLGDILNSTKGDISNRTVSIEWTCFPVTGYEVDKAANTLLAEMTGVKVDYTTAGTQFNVVTEENVAALDSGDYKYGIMDENSASKIETLVDAIKGETSGSSYV